MHHLSVIAAIALGAVILAGAASAQKNEAGSSAQKNESEADSIDRRDQANGIAQPKSKLDDGDMKALDPIKPPEPIKPPDPKTAPAESFGAEPLGSEAWEFGQPGSRTETGKSGLPPQSAGDAPLTGTQAPQGARPQPGSRLP